MPVSKHLNITPLQEERRRSISGERPGDFGLEAVRLLSRPLPFSAQRRNLLALLLFFATVAWFWQPLVTLFSLTQQQEHYSHIVLIPCLSLFVLFLDRKAIHASREWSPWLGSLVIGLGAWGYWRADSATLAADQLSMMVLSLVVMCWGIFVFGFGVTVDPNEAKITQVSPVNANPSKTPNTINGGIYAARADVVGVGLAWTYGKAPDEPKPEPKPDPTK